MTSATSSPPPPPVIGRSLFVDDLAVWHSASSTRAVSRQLQLSVARLERWSTENGLRFSTTKPVAVHFLRRRCSDPHLRIQLYGQSIPTEPTARFLGILFDRRLTYKPHFNILRQRCFNSQNVLKWRRSHLVWCGSQYASAALPCHHPLQTRLRLVCLR